MVTGFRGKEETGAQQFGGVLEQSKAPISPSRARNSRHRQATFTPLTSKRLDRAWVYKKRLERLVFMDEKQGTWCWRWPDRQERMT